MMSGRPFLCPICVKVIDVCCDKVEPGNLLCRGCGQEVCFDCTVDMIEVYGGGYSHGPDECDFCTVRKDRKKFTDTQIKKWLIKKCGFDSSKQVVKMMTKDLSESEKEQCSSENNEEEVLRSSETEHWTHIGEAEEEDAEEEEEEEKAEKSESDKDGRSDSSVDVYHDESDHDRTYVPVFDKRRRFR